MNNYRIGQVVKGTITGIRPYGAFVEMDDGTVGMIHISEISDFYVRDVGQYFNRGEKVVVRIIDIDSQGQLRLSLKAIQSHRKVAIPSKKDIIELNNIGFRSLAEKLPEWIKEAEKTAKPEK